MTISHGRDSFELDDYLRVLRRRWRMVLVLACVGLAVSVGYYKVSPKTYTATTAVYVNATTANNNQTVGRTGGPVNMDNEAQIVQSQLVAVRAAAEMHSALPWQTLVKRVSVTVPPNTTVLDISCKTRPRTAAATCANDFASAYLSVQLSEAAGTISSAISALQAKAQVLTNQISRLKAQAGSQPASSPKHTTTEIRLGADNSQLAEIQSQINQLVPELASLQAPGNTLVGHLISRAVPPASASSPRALLLLPSGLLAGLLAGLVAAFVAERRDDRIHAASDVERFLDLPVLLSISAKDVGATGGPARLRPLADGEFAELARHIAASLGDDSYILAVTGTSAGSGGSVVAANLAVMLARTGAEVTLVCPDRATLSPKLLGVNDAGQLGLPEMLTAAVPAANVARRPPGTSRLQLIPPGLGRPTPLSSVEQEAIRGVLAELRLGVRFVIIETSAVGDEAESFVLAEFADAAIIAIEEGVTTRSDAEDCLLRLDRFGTTALGAAVIPASGGGTGRPRRRRSGSAPSPIRRPALKPTAVGMAGPSQDPWSGRDPWSNREPWSLTAARAEVPVPGSGQAELAGNGSGQLDGPRDPADSTAEV